MYLLYDYCTDNKNANTVNWVKSIGSERSQSQNTKSRGSKEVERAPPPVDTDRIGDDYCCAENTWGEAVSQRRSAQEQKWMNTPHIAKSDGRSPEHSCPTSTTSPGRVDTGQIGPKSRSRGSWDPDNAGNRPKIMVHDCKMPGAWPQQSAKVEHSYGGAQYVSPKASPVRTMAHRKPWAAWEMPPQIPIENKERAESQKVAQSLRSEGIEKCRDGSPDSYVVTTKAQQPMPDHSSPRKIGNLKGDPKFDPAWGEDPLYTVPEELARCNNLSHQVQTGPSTAYIHKTSTPRYMDSHENPYAVFVFQYRSQCKYRA